MLPGTTIARKAFARYLKATSPRAEARGRLHGRDVLVDADGSTWVLAFAGTPYETRRKA